MLRNFAKTLRQRALPLDRGDAPSPLLPVRFDTLRIKTLLIVALTLVGLLLILYLPLRAFLLGSFQALEEQMLHTNMQRVESALIDELRTLDTLNASYAIWDDTYAFVADRNQGYIEKNAYDQVFIDTQLGLLLIADTAGQVLFAKSFDLSAGRPIALPDRLRSLAAGDPLLDAIKATSSITGVVLLPDGPMLIATHPILTSEGGGPARGTLMMGRYLDAEKLRQMADTVHLSFSLLRADVGGASGELRAARAAIDAGAASFVRPLDDLTVVGYTPLRDIDGDASMLLRVEMSRSIYTRGREGIDSFMLLLLLVGALFGALMLGLLERAVLARLARLSAGVQQIGASGDLTARVAVSGSDELGRLAAAINGMLTALERAQAERAQAEEERERVRLQEESLRVKREFISIVSHELRSPLTPIMGFVDLLLADTRQITERQAQLLQTVRSSTERLGALVDDLLEIGRVETGKVDLRRAPLDLAAAIDDALGQLQPDIERKGIALITDIADPLPPLEADARRIGQVLVNLLSNAVKYSYPGGTVTISAFQCDGKSVEVQVRDTGVGLTPEQQTHLFTPFYRADNPLREQVRGTGLGLSIVKAFVELHGGTVGVSSEAGVGSVFTFSLPISAPP